MHWILGRASPFNDDLSALYSITRDSVAVSQLQGPWFKSKLGLLSVWSIACSSSGLSGFLHLLKTCQEANCVYIVLCNDLRNQPGRIPASRFELREDKLMKCTNFGVANKSLTVTCLAFQCYNIINKHVAAWKLISCH